MNALGTVNITLCGSDVESSERNKKGCDAVKVGIVLIRHCGDN